MQSKRSLVMEISEASVLLFFAVKQEPEVEEDHQAAGDQTQQRLDAVDGEEDPLHTWGMGGLMGTGEASETRTSWPEAAVVGLAAVQRELSFDADGDQVPAKEKHMSAWRPGGQGRLLRALNGFEFQC